MTFFFGRKNEKKPSKHQQRDNAKAASGRESLNERANKAAQKAGLNASQKQAFHRELTATGDNTLSFAKLLEMAKGHK